MSLWNTNGGLGVHFSQCKRLLVACVFVQLFWITPVWADSLRLLETRPQATTPHDSPEADNILVNPSPKVEPSSVVEPQRQNITIVPVQDAAPDNSDTTAQVPGLVVPEPENRDLPLSANPQDVVSPENTVIPSTPLVNDVYKETLLEENGKPFEEKPQTQEIVPVIVQPPTRRPGITIEDILADPMKNKQDAERRDSLNLPKDTAKLDFLEGKWRCETDLINMETQEPIVMDFVFDREGKGTVRLREKTGRVFSGSAKATLKNNTLAIDVSKLKTAKSNTSYNGSRIQCQQKGQTAVCKGKNLGSPALEWNNATFHRLK